MRTERIPPNISRPSSEKEKAAKLQGLVGEALQMRRGVAQMLMTYGQSIGWDGPLEVCHIDVQVFLNGGQSNGDGWEVGEVQKHGRASADEPVSVTSYVQLSGEFDYNIHHS